MNTPLEDRQVRLNRKFAGEYISVHGKYTGICKNIEAFGPPSGTHAFYVIHFYSGVPSQTVYDSRRIKVMSQADMYRLVLQGKA